MLKPPTVILAAAMFLAAAPASADLQLLPKHPKKMTVQLAYHATTNKAMAEVTDYPQGAVEIIEHCAVMSRRRGTCDYTMITASPPGEDGYSHGDLYCQRRSTVRLAKRTHRVSTTTAPRANCTTERPDLDDPLAP